MRHLAQSAVVAAIVMVVSFCGGQNGGESEDGDTAAPEAVDSTAMTETSAGTANAAVVSGQAVFASNCATCHGDQGRGDGPAATGLEPPPSDLADSTWTTGDGSLAAIANTIENGSPGTSMIGWKGTLTDAEIAAVAGHVKGLSEGP